MLIRIKKSELPEYVSVSPHHLEQCKELAVISHFGNKYYIPLTPMISKLLTHNCAEEIIRDIIGATYIQIRDTVGREIHQQLSGQIGEGFEKLFEKALFKEINQRLLKD